MFRLQTYDPYVWGKQTYDREHMTHMFERNRHDMFSGPKNPKHMKMRISYVCEHHISYTCEYVFKTKLKLNPNVWNCDIYEWYVLRQKAFIFTMNYRYIKCIYHDSFFLEKANIYYTYGFKDMFHMYIMHVFKIMVNNIILIAISYTHQNNVPLKILNQPAVILMAHPYHNRRVQL